MSDPEPPSSTEEATCDGICLTAADIGVGGSQIAYPHPGCPLHAPDEQCGCGSRMCRDCGGPWCAICGERVPTIPWADEMVCDTCHPKLVRFGLALPAAEGEDAS